MIEWRFGLAPLTVRTTAARNLVDVLDFSGKPNLKPPRYNVPKPITLGRLVPQHAHSGEDRPDLAELAVKRGLEIHRQK